MNYDDLIELYLHNNSRKYVNNNSANFNTRGLDGLKDYTGKIAKYGDYINNAGSFLSNSNNSLIKNVGDKISSFGSNISATSGQIHNLLDKPQQLINTVKDTALTKAGGFLQGSSIPAIQKLGSGLAAMGGSAAAKGGALAAGPWGAVAALATTALQGTNRKRAAASGENLIGNSLKRLSANTAALEKEQQAEEERILRDMYSKYGWVQ